MVSCMLCAEGMPHVAANAPAPSKGGAAGIFVVRADDEIMESLRDSAAPVVSTEARLR